jgi:two-component system OmpR family response regulator
VARRYVGNPNPLLRFGEIEVDRALRTVSIGGKAIDLTSREWAVFERLTQNAKVIVSKAQIEDSLYAFGAEVESNAVEVYISRLRKKLGHDAIETVRGLGYRIASGA